ncbi:MAG: hypothetical protein JSV89_15060 [Spirochaetaceae bacterium]|nr:MAG: hypothetical protein JSV89_15060 [Spirochaetaceae bacterium]
MLRRAIVLFLCLFCSLPAFSMWKTLKTEAFTVFYPLGREREAREILEVLEYYRAYAGELVGAPPRRVAIVLEDIGTESNGLTDVANRRILLFRYPPSTGELGYHQNWWRLVGIHEYTHWGHLSGAEGLPAVLTALFGKNMAPGNYTPGWLKEGVCVVAESGISPFEGRLNEGLFGSYATILAQTGSLPTIVQATYNMNVFPGGTGPYLFGGQFLEFLVHKYGRQPVSRFFVHYGASILSYLSPALPAVGLDRSARKVFGESIRSLWLEWQLEVMKKGVSFKRPEGALTEHGWWLNSPVVWKGGVYYQHSFPVKPAPFSTTWHHQLLRLDPESGRQRIMMRSAAPFSGPMRIRFDKLYYGLLEIEGGYDNHFFDRFGFTTVLYSRDLGSGPGSARRLFKESFRTFEVLADGSILTARDREDTFGSEIWLHDPERGTSSPLLATDVLVSDMVADSRAFFVAARADWHNTQIFRILIPGWSGEGRSLSGVNPADIRLEKLHDTPYQESELCLAEGRLFYSATYGARRTLYEYEIDTGVVNRSVASDFARSPAWDEENRALYFVGLNARGEDLYREKSLAREITVPNDSAIQGAPSSVELSLPDDAVRSGGYGDNLATLLPRSLFPLFNLDPYLSSYQAGAGIAGTSALGDIRYVLVGYYDSYYQQPQIEADLQINVLSPLTATFDLAASGDTVSVEFIELSLTLDWLLYRSLGKGLSSISLGTTGTLVWDWLDGDSRILIPYTLVGFRGAASALYFQVGVYCLHDVDESDFGYLLLPGIYSSVVFLGVQLSLQASLMYDLTDNTWSLPWVPPGYPDELSGSWGGFVSSTLSIPLLRLRGGLWNPGLYFGDIFLVPFVSLTFNQDRDLQGSYGGTLRLEMKTGARDEGFPLDLYAGLGMTLEGRPLVLLGLEIPGNSGGYARIHSNRRFPKPALGQ